MVLTSGLLLGGIASLAGLAAGQFPPKPEGVTVLKSKFHEDVTISYKEPGICETTPGVRSYAGHVRLPPGFLDDVNGEAQDYEVNTFFWFFEARKNPENAPLAIWLNGGPGGSSLMGLLEENGPCIISPDSKSTTLNPWSWNNEVNMLYIDEPNQVGFSYDEPTNCTVSLDAVEGVDIVPADFSNGLPELNLTSMAGTFASQNLSHTVNSTAQAAHALWHFAQTWFFEFPAYRPTDDRISLWAESYGGHYGPGFMRFFQEQNEKIANGTIEVEHAHYLHLDTLGIVNGLLDAVLQEEAYIHFPYNNTYGIQVFNESLHAELWHNFTREGGCKEQSQTCQDKLAAYDTVTINRGAVNVAEVCDISEWCESPATDIYQSLGHGWYDIGHPNADPFPPPHMHGYITQEEVLAAIGSPVNFTTSSHAVSTSFHSSRDMLVGGFLDAVGYLLDSGVKVHMMYGDRDYACNWMGGEMASLAIPYSRADDFADAGYAHLWTSEGYKGLTRQFGNFSFSRVFQAGHEVPSYQRAASYDIFMRATFNRDIATGLLPVSDEYSSFGFRSAWDVKNIPPPKPEPTCYLMKPSTCLPEVWEAVRAGTAVVRDFFVVSTGEDDYVEIEKPADSDQDVIGEL